MRHLLGNVSVNRAHILSGVLPIRTECARECARKHEIWPAYIFSHVCMYLGGASMPAGTATPGCIVEVMRSAGVLCFEETAARSATVCKWHPCNWQSCETYAYKRHHCFVCVHWFWTKKKKQVCFFVDVCQRRTPQWLAVCYAKHCFKAIDKFENAGTPH